jgi:tetratricopeptide (TPR) repeat protein
MGKSNLAKIYCSEAKYKEAEELSRECYEQFKVHFDADHPYVANCASNLAEVYIAEKKTEEAVPLCESALASRKKAFSDPHPKVAHSLDLLAQVRELQGRNDDAISLYQESLSMYDKVFATRRHPEIDSVVQRYSTLLQKTGRSREADALKAQRRQDVAVTPASAASR